MKGTLTKVMKKGIIFTKENLTEDYPLPMFRKKDIYRIQKAGKNSVSAYN